MLHSNGGEKIEVGTENVKKSLIKNGQLLLSTDSVKINFHLYEKLILNVDLHIVLLPGRRK